MASLGVRFGRALIMVRGSTGVAAAVNFYQNGLGMVVVRHTDSWAELTCPVGHPTSSTKAIDIASATNGNVSNNNTTPTQVNFHLSIQSNDTESQLSTGYSPFLNFDVEDMDSTVARCVQMGANLDGPIQYPAMGKVAALRSPDGHMIGLYEPTM